MLVGIDLGGTKIETAGFDAESPELTNIWRNRVATPDNYQSTLEVLSQQITAACTHCALPDDHPIGVGCPGCPNPKTGLIRNANSTWLNGQNLAQDLKIKTGHPVRLQNDANCFIRSEARDGAAKGFGSAFGVIIGTGCGGGVWLGTNLWPGASGIAGEWGHNSLPWPGPNETPGPSCWCGQQNCLESWLSGPGMLRHYQQEGGPAHSVEELARRALAGDQLEQSTLDQYANRLARGLAQMINLLDVEVIVLGGGLSNLPQIAERTERLIGQWVFSDASTVRIVQNHHGDSSGVRGAALLWANERPS
ncbi:MAG: hypothetical protein COA47_12565 [Robiginitomaculum sp.]|nr:MAG: hypothetical protein COA47_12565 [Robiginitomaculum sp.]